jgi:release factor glutamine methyltransferase
VNIRQALARSQPAPPGSTDSYSLEAQLLLAEITGQTRTWVLAHQELDLTGDQEEHYARQLQLIQSGTPLAYILGRQEFFGRSFRVNPATLIPRPETELLIEAALTASRNSPSGFYMVDVGTGTGCIGITIACENPAVRVIAIDSSLEALQIARKNAVDHEVLNRWVMVQAHLLDSLIGRYFLICANLPYIPSARLESLEVSRHEPRTALDGGEDGLRYTRPLISQLPGHLHPAGSAILEIDHGQAVPLSQLAEACLPHRPVRLQKDYAGLERVLVIGPEGG